MIVVLSEVPTQAATVDKQENEAIIAAAQMFGCRVYQMPADFEVCETAENALAHVPTFDEPIIGVWVGFIPTSERYTAIYEAALQKNVQLVNSPLQHQQAMEFHRFYSRLGELTPKSLIVEDVSQLAEVEHQLGYPLFVKGTVKSDKEAGWQAVVAHDAQELQTIVTRVLAHAKRSRGKAIVRQLVKLNILAHAPNGFPIGREYRAFLHKGKLLVYGFYWDIDAPPLSREEERQIIQLAQEAARRVDTPFLAVDIAQREEGEWIVMEVGDAQFCGLSHVPVLALWGKIKDFAL